MKYCGDKNFFLLSSVDHTVAVSQQFPYVLIVKLRNFSPAARKTRQ